MSLVDDFQAEAEPAEFEVLGKNSWMVRPCEWYKDEHRECTRIRARFHQMFIHGSIFDCTQWKEDYSNCMSFRKKKSVDSLNKVVESELKRREDRLGASARNDIWTYRTEPPKDFNGPLPQWFLDQNKNTYLEAKQAERLQREKRQQS